MRELSSKETTQVCGGNQNAASGMNYIPLPSGFGLAWIVGKSLTETTNAINNIDMKQQLGPGAS